MTTLPAAPARPRSTTRTSCPTRSRPSQRTATPILLLFAQHTCGPSRRLEGFVAHVLQRRHNHDSFRFRIIEREQRPDLFERFHVTDTPTLLVIDGGRVQRRQVGFAKPCDVEDMLAPWLK